MKRSNGDTAKMPTYYIVNGQIKVVAAKPSNNGKNGQSQAIRAQKRRAFEQQHERRYRLKRIEAAGIEALIQTWEPYAEKEKEGGNGDGECVTYFKHLLERQRKVLSQLKVMRP